MIDPRIEPQSRRPGTLALAPGIAISSRIRLARNLSDVTFPGWASGEELTGVLNRVFEAASCIPLLRHAVKLDVRELDPVEREYLRERHLISACLAGRKKAAGVILARDESFSIMVNEEDHLRIQVMAPNMALESLLKTANAIDDALERRLPMAFSHSFGYLTVCPSNMGTGMRASVMAHLPGLALIEEIDQVARGLDFLGFTVRGWGGEGTDAWGNMYQISNRYTLGRSEIETVQWMEDAVAEVVDHEANARARLMEQRKDFLVDQIARSLGILKFARLIPSEETLSFLSLARLGVELGVVNGISVDTLVALMQAVQPGHIQKHRKCGDESERRDAFRARMTRTAFKKATLAEQD